MPRDKNLIEMDFDEKDEWAAGILNGYKVPQVPQGQIERTAHQAVSAAALYLSPRARWRTRVVGRSIALAVIIFFGVFFLRHLEPAVISLPGESAQFTDIQEIEQAAEVIVQVYPLSQLESALVDSGLRTPPYVAKTFTRVRVSRVFSGDGVEVGNELVVVEPWASRRMISGLYMVTEDVYSPMVPRNSYILFLERNESDQWVMVGGYQGKYVLGQEEVAQEVENLPGRLQVKEVRSSYLNLYRQVIARFGWR